MFFINDKTNTAFILSKNIQAFPCSRRRVLDNDSIHRIPFDPEARLNTEANNRKHSSINGYTQTFLDCWNIGGENSDGLLSLALDGYLFNITLQNNQEANYSTYDAFAEAITEEGTAIYANIIINDVPLFGGTVSYTTGVLGSQTEVNDSSLDLLITQAGSNALSNVNNYYFSGLSFTTTPRAVNPEAGEDLTIITQLTGSNQKIVSLRILDKADDGTWHINEQARLPYIRHGSEPNSVLLGNLEVDDLKAQTADIEALSATNAAIANADITELTGNTATITTINANTVKADYLIQKQDEKEHPVPIIGLFQDKDDENLYQLKLWRLTNTSGTGGPGNFTPDPVTGLVIFDGGTVG